MTDTQMAVSEEKKEAVQARNKVTDYSLGIFGTSDNFIMAMQMKISIKKKLRYIVK